MATSSCGGHFWGSTVQCSIDLLISAFQITKMELQLQQQRLISMEGIENSTFRALVTKLINVALAMLAVILVFVSTIANFATPFLTSRFVFPTRVC